MATTGPCAGCKSRRTSHRNTPRSCHRSARRPRASWPDMRVSYPTTSSRRRGRTVALGSASSWRPDPCRRAKTREFRHSSPKTTRFADPRAGFGGNPYAEGVAQHSPGSPQAHPGSRTPQSPVPQRGSTARPSRNPSEEIHHRATESTEKNSLIHSIDTTPCLFGCYEIVHGVQDSQS